MNASLLGFNIALEVLIQTSACICAGMWVCAGSKWVCFFATCVKCLLGFISLESIPSSLRGTQHACVTNSPNHVTQCPNQCPAQSGSLSHQGRHAFFHKWAVPRPTISKVSAWGLFISLWSVINKLCPFYESKCHTCNTGTTQVFFPPNMPNQHITTSWPDVFLYSIH